MNVPNSLTPITWKYGAIAAGVGLSQGLGYIWYHPQVFGSTWARNHPVAVHTRTEKDQATNMIVSALSDASFAVLLNYLSHRYFRPLTPTDALIFTGIVAGLTALPMIPHVLWQKTKPEDFAIDRGYDFFGTLVKIMCLMYIPY